MAHSRHEEVRQRYGRCCGYCGVSETETGGELTVDHYCPVGAGGDESEANLVYACFRCNSYKADFHPDAADEQHARRILHPHLDMLSLHVRENPETNHLEGLSGTGQFHIALLRLNRPQLVELRVQRRLARLLAETCDLLETENRSLRHRIAVLEEYLRLLRLPHEG